MKNPTSNSNNRSTLIKDTLEKNSQLENSIFSAEVVDIILNKSHPEYSGDVSIGAIRFKTVSGPSGFAKPLNPYFKTYPVIHESVIILKGNSTKSGVVNQASTYYYFTSVNVWQLINANPSPFSSRSTDSVVPSVANDYTKFSGNMPSAPEINFGEDFEQKLDIPDLVPFEGDNVIQGRWGNSVRFGSTVLNKAKNWSTEGQNGEPIIIIRVDKKENDVRFIEESINEDGSSIYICDGQLISLTLANQDIPSYDATNSEAKPDLPSKFFGRQILMNSDRIVLNARSDYFLISAEKSIGFSTNGSINFDSKKPIILESEKIYSGAGASNEKEPMALGQTLADILTSIVEEIQKLTVQTAVGLSSVPVNTPQFIEIQQKINTILSKKSFVE